MERVERLARYGPQAAYASAAGLLVLFLLQQYGGDLGASGPIAYTIVVILFDLSLWVFIGGLYVLALHLERRGAAAAPAAGSSPETMSSGAAAPAGGVAASADPASAAASRLRIGRRALTVALIAPIALVVGQLVSSGILIALGYAVIFLAVGVGVFVYNIEARRLGLAAGLLPWFGQLAAAGYVIAGIGFASAVVGLEILFVIGFYVLLVGEILYVGWSAWLAGNLRHAAADAS